MPPWLQLASGVVLILATPVIVFHRIKDTVTDVIRWVRTRRGVQVEGTILETRVASDPKGDAPPSFFVTLAWSWDTLDASREFQVPRKWYDRGEGAAVPLLVNPDRPSIAIIEHWITNPGWVFFKGGFFTAVGAAFLLFGFVLLFGGLAELCPGAGKDALGTVCEGVERFLRSIRDR